MCAGEGTWVLEVFPCDDELGTLHWSLHRVFELSLATSQFPPTAEDAGKHPKHFLYLEVGAGNKLIAVVLHPPTSGVRRDPKFRLQGPVSLLGHGV